MNSIILFPDFLYETMLQRSFEDLQRLFPKIDLQRLFSSKKRNQNSFASEYPYLFHHRYDIFVHIFFYKLCSSLIFANRPFHFKIFGTLKIFKNFQSLTTFVFLVSRSIRSRDSRSPNVLPSVRHKR